MVAFYCLLASRMLPSVIGGLLPLLISAFDDLSEFPAPFREAELCWAKAGIPFCDVIGDQTLDVEQINAAVEVHFALACRKPPNEVDFIGCWVDHSCTPSRLDDGGQDLEPIAVLLEARSRITPTKLSITAS